MKKQKKPKAGKTSSLINKEKVNMPKEFGEERPLKIIYSPTITP